MPYTVLLFGPDAVSLAAMREVLSRTKCHSTLARSESELRDLAPPSGWDVAIIDLLSDPTVGLEVLKTIRQQPRPPACVVTVRFGHDRIKGEAKSLGAFDCIEQPLTATLVTAVVHAAAASRTGGSASLAPDDVRYALARWADVVVRVVESSQDVRTLNEWGRAAAVSAGALRNWCRTAGISARRSLLFARLLRAVVRQSRTGGAPEDLLNVVDRRTLVKMLRLAGGDGLALPSDARAFLAHQQFVTNTFAVRVVAAALESRGIRGAHINGSDEEAQGRYGVNGIASRK